MRVTINMNEPDKLIVERTEIGSRATADRLIAQLKLETDRLWPKPKK